MDLTIEQLESRLEEQLAKSGAFRPYVPEGYRPHVTLLSNDKAKSRKKKRNASADSWSPDLGEIMHVSFERVESPAAAVMEEHREPLHQSAPLAEAKSPVQSPSIDLIRALDRAESRPGFGFVALKWFRDLCLPAGAFDWDQSAEARDKQLRAVIDSRWVLTSKVPNPKAPQFPVTTLRVNRQHPEVARILGAQVQTPVEFDPIKIRGEKLSETILHQRR
jgi:predicted nucleic acid-binding protein